MAGTAYADATLREVLDMQIGVAYSEPYADPKAQIWDYARADGFRARMPDYDGPSCLHEFLFTLRKEGEHGHAFAYKSLLRRWSASDARRTSAVRATGAAIAGFFHACA